MCREEPKNFFVCVLERERGGEEKLFFACSEENRIFLDFTGGISITVNVYFRTSFETIQREIVTRSEACSAAIVETFLSFVAFFLVNERGLVAKRFFLPVTFTVGKNSPCLIAVSKFP